MVREDGEWLISATASFATRDGYGSYAWWTHTGWDGARDFIEGHGGEYKVSRVLTPNTSLLVLTARVVGIIGRRRGRHDR